jgi:MFS transporter, MHS family, proline/betaine transporter
MSTTVSNDETPLRLAGQHRVVNTALFATLAWSCDLFDLFIILFVAPTIGVLFFPSNDPILSLAAVYASYAITLVMRPLGSAIFGPFADKHGRRRAMVISVGGIGFITGLMGLLPTINQVGILAPILFLSLRVLQGVFVGGVVSSSHTIGTETVAANQRGLVSGIIGSGAAIGSLLASGLYFIVSHIFPGESFHAFGWRMMFFGGFLGAGLSFLIHRLVQESPIWIERTTARVTSPLKTILTRNYAKIHVVNLMIVIGAATQIYLTQSFLPAFLKLVNRLPEYDQGGILVTANFIAIVATPLFGALSDVVGRKRVFMGLAAANLLLIPLCYLLLSQLTGENLGMIYFYAGILTFCGNAALAPIIIFLNERFATAERATGTSLSWNIGFAVGGMMPTFVTLASGSAQHVTVAVLAFLGVAIVMYGIGAILIPETQGNMDTIV